MRADPFFIQNSLSSLDQVQYNIQQLTSELSSGVSVTSLSSNPTAAAQDSMVANEISVDDTFTQNAATTQGLMQVTDATLSSLVTQLTSAISVATEGDNGTNNSSDEQAAAAELSGIQSTILGLANTSYQGVSIFAGSQASATAFTLDTSTSPATVTYNGDSDVLSMTTPSGQTLQTAIPGDQIFGGNTTGTSANVLGVLGSLINDLSTGNLTAAATQTTALSTSLSQVTAIQAQFGASLQQVQSDSTYTQTQVVQLQVSQNSLVADNPAQIATSLASSETQQSALMSVMAELEKSNDLFDYLN
jgi:flagellar hook-associated protein 3 FlgL